MKSIQTAAIALPRRTALADAAQTGIFALLTALGAQIVIPTLPVPLTLQTVAVLLSGAVLGARRGAYAQTAYLAMGAVGLPVFAGFSGSIAHILGPTGGYLLAFPFAAFISGSLTAFFRPLPRYFASLLAMTAAMTVVFACGVAWLAMFWLHDWNAAFAAGFTHLQVWDAVKLLSAAGIAASVGRFTR